MSDQAPAERRRLGRTDLEAIRALVRPAMDKRLATDRGGAAAARDVLVCAGGGCVSCRSRSLTAELERLIRERGLDERVRVVQVGCMGLCEAGPMVLVAPDGVYYPKVDADLARRIVDEHLAQGAIVSDAELSWSGDDGETRRSRDVPFFARQMKIALRNCGVVDPLRIEEYIGLDGYAALARVLFDLSPDAVVAELKRSGLRGRGGAGFPSGLKWQMVREAPGDEKYVICNGDEGDPGAFMDRSILEGDPHSVIEGMTIAGRVVGAQHGYLYVRAEYPLAIERLDLALVAARGAGLLGRNILHSGFDFDLEIRIGAGAFVCGEETALIASVEGRRGMPRPRPPFPAQAGLWGRPTLINNVETWANLPPIVNKGASWFASIGTERSKGTKVFALAGDVRNTGLVEVPMGISMRDVVETIGGGTRAGLPFKAVQAGGPSGGCVPLAAADVAVDYESLQRLGAVMGSGGLIVLNQRTCMVELARFFLEFLVDESCGKCPPCRIGLRAMLNIVERMTCGEGTLEDLDTLTELAAHIRRTSLCGLGQTAPNAVLSTLQHFREEYEAHVKYKRCPSAVCKGIISSPCQYLCPLGTDVPAYLALTAQGKYRDALAVIRRTNPLPAVCGRVCMAHCETRCRAAESGSPIAVKDIKRFLTDWELSSVEPVEVEPFVQRYDEQIAIVGSGPAGLTAAHTLARKGYRTTVFEALPVAGGMLAVGIPEYRLPRELLEREIDAIVRGGVTLKTNTPVTDVNALLSGGHAAVLLAVGAHKNRHLRIPGDDAAGVIDPLTMLRRVRLAEPVPPLGDRVGIVGGGNTAIDAARTAVRLGAREVTILYRRTRMEMPAAQSEVDAALEEGITIEFLVAPTRVLAVNGRVRGIELRRMRLGQPDVSGRRAPIAIEGSEFELPLDSIIPAISQDPDLAFLSDGQGIAIANGTIAVDPETFTTSKPGVFACGDAATGAGDVTTAMATARVAADLMHRYLRGDELARGYSAVRPAVVIEPSAASGDGAPPHRPDMSRLPAPVRIRGFQEVERGFSEHEAVCEAGRCLRCDWELQKELRLREADADQDVSSGAGEAAAAARV